jgi:hypothetical protein
MQAWAEFKAVVQIILCPHHFREPITMKKKGGVFIGKSCGAPNTKRECKHILQRGFNYFGWR